MIIIINNAIIIISSCFSHPMIWQARYYWDYLDKATEVEATDPRLRAPWMVGLPQKNGWFKHRKRWDLMVFGDYL
jgi:hypothetical protein